MDKHTQSHELLHTQAKEILVKKKEIDKYTKQYTLLSMRIIIINNNY